jgi:hypothetical protein
MAFLFTVGLTGSAAGIALLIRNELGGLPLLIPSIALLALAYSDRIRPPAGLRAEVQWHASSEILVLNCSECEGLSWCRSGEIYWKSVRAIVRTPAGFIIWPMDPIEVLLPNEAFASPEDIERFSRIARSQVFNHVDTRA